MWFWKKAPPDSSVEDPPISEPPEARQLQTIVPPVRLRSTPSATPVLGDSDASSYRRPQIAEDTSHNKGVNIKHGQIKAERISDTLSTSLPRVSTPPPQTTTPTQRESIPPQRASAPPSRSSTPPRRTSTPPRRTSTPPRRSLTPSRRASTPPPRTATPSPQPVKSVRSLGDEESSQYVTGGQSRSTVGMQYVEGCVEGMTGFIVTGMAMCLLIMISWFLITQLDFMQLCLTHLSKFFDQTLGGIFHVTQANQGSSIVAEPITTATHTQSR